MEATEPAPYSLVRPVKYGPQEGRNGMARYGRAASKSVKSAMHRKKSGTLKSGRGGKGGRVKSRKQAIAIGLSEARKKGAKVPRKKSS
jgi:hypothetical protein